MQIVEEGCRGVNLQPDDSEAALADMVAHGARRSSLADIIAALAHNPG